MTLKLIKRVGGAGVTSHEDVAVAVKTVTADYTITPNDHVILADASGAEVTITLPDLSDIPDERIFHIKKLDADSAGAGNDVVIKPGGA